jgi:hypothetical protein
MKSSGDTLEKAVKDIYLKPANLLVRKCLLEMDHIKLQLKMAKVLVQKAYEGEHKIMRRYEYDKLIEPYERLFHFVLTSRPQDAREGLAEIVKRKSFSSGYSNGRRFDQIKIPKDMLEFLKEEVKDVAE